MFWWNNWNIMKRVFSASVSINGLLVQGWPSEIPSFIDDPWPIKPTFSTMHFHSRLSKLSPKSLDFKFFIHPFLGFIEKSCSQNVARSWSMCFHPFATVPNRMEMQVPKVPKVAGGFPQPMEVLPVSQIGDKNTERRKPMDFMIFLFFVWLW